MKIMKKRFILALIVAVLAGGIWNLFGEPLTLWISKVLLSILTLGTQFMKNIIYSRVALGFHEEPAINSLFILFLGASFYYGGEVGKYVAEHIKDKQGEFKERPSLRTKVKLMDKSILVFFTLLWFVIAFQYTKASYCNIAVSHFENCFKICKPYLKPSEEELIESEFSQIKCREDYVKVINKLYSIGEDNNIHLEKFKAW